MAEIVERPRAGFVATVNWGAVFAGAVAAAALASVLHAFAGAIGLAVSSSAPTWRDASIGLWFLSGVYLVLVALASYGLGGYLTGMLCERYASSLPEESELRDNVHGLLSWAVATLITVALRPHGGGHGYPHCSALGFADELGRKRKHDRVRC